MAVGSAKQSSRDDNIPDKQARIEDIEVPPSSSFLKAVYVIAKTWPIYALRNLQPLSFFPPSQSSDAFIMRLAGHRGTCDCCRLRAPSFSSPEPVGALLVLHMHGSLSSVHSKEGLKIPVFEALCPFAARLSRIIR